MLGRLSGAWRELDRDQRLAGLTALALLATMFLPWYQKSVAVGRELANDNLNAFGVFTFVEAAVFLVALGVFLLLFARGERRGFHLPGGDGTVILAAGVWAGLLLLWRVFDRPDVEGQGATIGITWGFFFAFLAAAALAAIGWKIRAAARPEPPLLRADDGRADYGPRTAATEVAPRRRRPAPPRPAPSEQLTLEDATEVVDEREAAPPRELAPPPTPPDPAPPPRRERAAAPPPRDEEPPPRRERADEPPPRPSPPPLRPGVFDQDSAGDEPLRPGEIPRRSPD